MTTERMEFVTTSVGRSIKGFSFPIVLGTGGFFTRSEGANAVLAGIRQLILTNPGERVMRPGYGAGLRDFVFDNNDSSFSDRIKKRISSCIAKYEPRVRVSSIQVSTDNSWGAQDYNRILVKVRLNILDDLLRDHIVELIV